MKDKKSPYTDDFFRAILTLENLEECYRFFGGVCTPKEIRTIAQRFTVAKMLRDKRVYSDIVASTGSSTATISRVNRSMDDENDAYSFVFERLEKQ